MIKNFYKKCAIIYDKYGEPLIVCEVKDFVSEKEYKELKEKANKNLENRLKLDNEEKEKFKTEINKSIYDLAVAVKNYTNNK